MFPAATMISSNSISSFLLAILVEGEWCVVCVGNEIRNMLHLTVEKAVVCEVSAVRFHRQEISNSNFTPTRATNYLLSIVLFTYRTILCMILHTDLLHRQNRILRYSTTYCTNKIRLIWMVNWHYSIIILII